MCYVNEIKMLKDRKALLYKECFELEQEMIEFYSHDFEPRSLITGMFFAPKRNNKGCKVIKLKTYRNTSLAPKQIGKIKKKELDKELKNELDILYYSYDKKIRDINTKIANLGLNRAIIH